MKMQQEWTTEVPMHDLLLKKYHFIFGHSDEKSPIRALHKEIIAHILTLGDAVLIKVRKKAFARAVVLMNSWGIQTHGDPECIVLQDSSRNEVTDDKKLFSALLKSAQFSATFKNIAGKSCRGTV